MTRTRLHRKRSREPVVVDTRPPIVIGNRQIQNGMKLPRAAPPGDSAVFDVVIVCEQDVCKYGIQAVLKALSSPHTACNVHVLNDGIKTTTVCTKALLDAAAAFLTAPDARNCYDVYVSTSCSFNVRMQYRFAFACIKHFCRLSSPI